MAVAAAVLRAHAFLEEVEVGGPRPGEVLVEIRSVVRSGFFPFERGVGLHPFSDIARAVQDDESGRTVKAVLTMP